MKRIIATKAEITIAVIFLLGLIINMAWLQLDLNVICLLVIVGLVMEFLLEETLGYHSELFLSTFTLKDRNVNLLFCLGLASAAIYGNLLGMYMHELYPVTRSGAGVRITGTALIGLFYEFIMIKTRLRYYKKDSWIMGASRSRTSILGFPFAVIVLYLLAGCLPVIFERII